MKAEDSILKNRRWKDKPGEKIIKTFLMVNGYAALLFFLLIFFFLVREGYQALSEVDFYKFIYSVKTTSEGTLDKIYEWFPTSENPRYSLLPLIAGSFLTSFTAVFISTVIGIIIGIYLSEISSARTREILKPAIELFAGIPTVVLGFFMLVVGASLLQDMFHPANRLNAFLAALGLSVIIIPVIASFTEEALRAVPDKIRQASYALGATKWQTVTRVVIPAAYSGISAGVILGFGRAIGETMIALMATGNAGEITINVFRSVRTMTATIAAEMGEVSHDSTHYYALFFIGAVLFILTFLLNLSAALILGRMKKKIQAKQ